MPKNDHHIYGDDHPLVGMPCLYQGIPAIPYGSYDVQFTPKEPKRRLLAILSFWGSGGQNVVATSGIKPDDPELVPVDRQTPQGRRIYHKILAGLVDQIR